MTSLPPNPVVLIVEDDQDTGDLYAVVLRAAGFAPIQTRDGIDAVTQACAVRPAVIITDLVLRGPMDGLSLTRRLRDEPRTNDVPIVVVTGRVFDADREEAQRAGCSVFLTKPCLPDDLLAAVRCVIGLRFIARRTGRSMPRLRDSQDVA